MLVTEGFQQTPYALPPFYESDEALVALLKRLLPADLFTRVDRECKTFQDRLAGPIHEAALLADGVDKEATLTQYDHWGRRVDVLKTSEGWRKLKAIAQQEGYVSIFAERKEGQFSRIYGFAKIYLFVPESRYVGCPLSMTDGCARVLELFGTPEMKRDVLPLVASSDPTIAWSAGQWMTEKPGGSDVSLTETVARRVQTSGTPAPGDAYVLDGFKWFSSATDGNVSLALARTGEGKGARGLSLFLIKLRDPSGGPNGIHVHRMKKKYGTLSVPTAELSLSGTIGHLVGEAGKGVQTISTVLNITRLHSAISSISQLRRGLSIAKAFALVRHVGGEAGSLLADSELHTSTLVKVEVLQRALMQLTFEAVRLMGRQEVGVLREGEEWRLRLMTPVVKAFCSFFAVQELPNLMESLGGQGYMVENEFARLIADASVEKIWEGTTNVLALDVVRVIEKSKGAAIKAFVDWATSVLSSTTSLHLNSVTQILTSNLSLLVRASETYLSTTPPDPRLSRHLLFLIGYLSSSISLLEQAIWSENRPGEDAFGDKEVVKRWIGSGELEEVGRKMRGLMGGEMRDLAEERAVEKELVYGRVRYRESKL